MAVSIEYKLTGRGWSECIVEIDSKGASLTASYLSDALADLLNAVTSLVRGNDEAAALFMEEPGEYSWQFKRISKERLSIRILWFDKTLNDRLDLEGKVILETECRLRTFAGATLSASQRVLEIYGLEGYREKWGNHDFPIILQAKLKEALG